MSHRASPTAEERLFLIPPPASESAEDDGAQPARARRLWRAPVDNSAAGPAEWTPPPWPAPVDHEIALLAHARRVRGAAVTSTLGADS